jgi:hypothetical protein
LFLLVTKFWVLNYVSSLHCKLQAPLYWDVYANLGFNSARICFTCHNFEYQGIAPAQDLAYCGLDVDHLDRPDRMRDNSHGRINVVKVFTYGKFVTGELGLDFSLMVALTLLCTYCSGCSCIFQHCDNCITNICTRGSLRGNIMTSRSNVAPLDATLQLMY